MRPIRPPHALLVPFAVVALAAACDEPPPVVGEDRLFASATAAEVVQGRDTQITVTSLKADGGAGAGDVTATIAPAGIGRIAATGTAATEQTATATLSDEGIATFDFACDVTGNADDAKATITVSGATGEATTSVTCTPQVIRRNIVLSVIDCQNRLQADGASSCTVDVTVRDLVNNEVSDVTIDVAVETVTVIGAGAGNGNVLKALVDDQVATNSLNDLVTDANGVARFVIISPTLGLEQTMKIEVIDDAGNIGSADVTIGPFEDKSEVTLSASPTSTSSNGSTAITVAARQLNGDLAVGTATVTVPAPLTATVAGCLAATAEERVFTARLDNGACTFTAEADDVGNAPRTSIVTASFQAPNGAPRNAQLPVVVNPAGVSIANVTVEPAAIFADGRDPTVSTITVDLTLDNRPVNGAVVTATVASESRGIIKLTTRQVGNGAAQAVANEDTAAVTSDAVGKVSFTLTADNATARGNGRVTITVVDADGNSFDVVDPANLIVTVDREPLLSSLVFDGFESDGVIGVPGGPRASSTGVRFRLLDEQNDPVANVPVRFVAQSSVPGISVVPFGNSDAAGLVTTVVTAGRVAGPITVVAIIETPALSAVSPAIAVIGGLPNSAYSNIVCDTVAAQIPSTDCTVVLADKFTNLVETDLNVQFRAEGGNITPSAAAIGGTATASFLPGPPGSGSADLRNWSYSALRTPPTDLVDDPAFDGCFDATARTPCDLVALCTSGNAAIDAFCPLPPSLTGQPTSCASDIDLLALDALELEAANPGDWEFSLFTNLDSAALTADEVREQFNAYVDSQRICGITLGCLVGDRDGLSLDDSDDCPVNPGCLDFSRATECPQDGLLDILASVRGEEGFDDENGNGVRDAGEDFVDFPEPFLDKNSSCSYDNLNDNPRLTASQKIQFSDLFIDSDASDGLFGFDVGGDRRETNGAFDSDTEVFLKTSVVQLGPPSLQFGFEVNPAVCGNDGTGSVTCPAGAQAAAISQSRCTETARGEAILEGCSPGGGNFRDGETATYAFRWTDRNGNCPTTDFAGEPTVTAEGPVEIAVNDSPYSQVECGAVPGGGGSKNLERPWCEEHVNMGAPAREVTLIAKCEGETGEQVIKLTFELDGAIAVRTFVLSCPVCGDNLVEGEEQCDDGDRDVGDGCDADCAVEE